MANSLNTFDIYLQNLDGPLPVQAIRAKALNGLFHVQMGERYPTWEDQIHDPHKSLPNPFSLALLTDQGMVAGLRITTLETSTGAMVADVWNRLEQGHMTVRLGSAWMAVIGMQASEVSCTELYETTSPARGMRMAFISPTRLKFNHQTTLLPVPRAVWQFYALRWETYAGIPLPADQLAWIDLHVAAVQVDLQTVYAYADRQVEWCGVVGEVTYEAGLPVGVFDEEQALGCYHAWQVLARFAEYSGTGEKVTQGMGRTVYQGAYLPVGMRELHRHHQEQDRRRIPSHQDLLSGML